MFLVECLVVMRHPKGKMVERSAGDDVDVGGACDKPGGDPWKCAVARE